jgi:hypothetical protein
VLVRSCFGRPFESTNDRWCALLWARSGHETDKPDSGPRTLTDDPRHRDAASFEFSALAEESSGGCPFLRARPPARGHPVGTLKRHPGWQMANCPSVVVGTSSWEDES